MNTAHKETRKFLNSTDMIEYNEIIACAKLTARQREISKQKFVEGRKNFQIAMDLEVSPETIRNELYLILDRAEKVIHKFYTQ